MTGEQADPDRTVDTDDTVDTDPAPLPPVPARSPQARIGPALGVLVVLGVVGVPVTWVVRDSVAGLSALAGLALVAAFFTMSTLAVSWADRIAPALTLPIALATYTGKVIVLAILLAGLRGTSVDLPAFAVAIIVGVFGWLGAQLWPVLIGGAAAATGPPTTG